MHKFIDAPIPFVNYCLCELCGLTLRIRKHDLTSKNIDRFRSCQKQIIINASHNWKRVDGDVGGVFHTGWICCECGYEWYDMNPPHAEVCEEQIMRKALG